MKNYIIIASVLAVISCSAIVFLYTSHLDPDVIDAFAEKIFSPVEDVDISIKQTSDKSGLQIIIKSGYPDGIIYYTLDGTTPTKNSLIYTKPVEIELQSVTVKAFVFLSGLTKSEISTASKFIQVLKPEISPYSGDYFGPITVSITSQDPKAELYYSIRNADKQLYRGPFEISESDGELIVNAWAVRKGWNDSEKHVQKYTFPLFQKEYNTISFESGYPLYYENKYYPYKKLFLQISESGRDEKCLLIFDTNNKEWKLISSIKFAKDESPEGFFVADNADIFCFTKTRGRFDNDICTFYSIARKNNYTNCEHLYTFENQDFEYHDESFVFSPSALTMSVILESDINLNKTYHLLLVSNFDNVWKHDLFELDDKKFLSYDEESERRNYSFTTSPGDNVFISKDGLTVAVRIISKIHLFKRQKQDWTNEKIALDRAGDYSEISFFQNNGTPFKESSVFRLESDKNSSNEEYYRYSKNNKEIIIPIKRTPVG